jgi:uncharacterized protein YceK
MKLNLGNFLAIGLVSFLLGCSSIRARHTTSPAEWTVYPGVRRDVQDMAELLRRQEPLWVKGLATGILLVDLPCSAVFDTLVAPYDWYRLYAAKKQAEAP